MELLASLRKRTSKTDTSKIFVSKQAHCTTKTSKWDGDKPANSVGVLMEMGGLIYASAALSQSKLSAVSIGKAQELVLTWWRGEIPIPAGNRRLVFKFSFIYFIFKRIIWRCCRLPILYNIGDKWRNVGYWWNNPDGRKTESTRRETFPSTTFSTTNPTLCGQGQNPGLRGGRQATNCLRHGTAIYIIDWVVRIQIF